MDKKRKKGYYIKCARGKKSKHCHTLEAGMRGFFITCNQMEDKAVREAYSLLNEYADKLYGPEKAAVTSESEEDDVEAAMKKEVEALKQQHKQKARRFQAVDTGAGNCIFISTTLQDPAAICDSIMEELHCTKTSKSRRIMKLLPVVGSCKTDLEKIRTFALDMIETQLKGVTEFTYGVEIKIRINGELKKNDVMQAVTQAVSDLKPLAKVKLSDPDYVISVNVIKRVFCLSVLKNFMKYRKYNLQEIVAVKDAAKKGDKQDKNESENTESNGNEEEKSDEKNRKNENTV